MTKYYLEILQKIDDHLQNKNVEEARLLIQKELEAPYLPTDFANQLKKRKKLLPALIARGNVSKYQIWSAFENVLQTGNNYQSLIPWILLLDKQKLEKVDSGYLNFVFSAKNVPPDIKFLLFLTIRKSNFNYPIAYFQNEKFYECVPNKIDPFQKYGVYEVFKTIETHFAQWPTALLSMKETVIRLTALFFPIENTFPWNDIITILWEKYCFTTRLNEKTWPSFIREHKKTSFSLDDSKSKYRKYLESTSNSLSFEV